MIASRASWRFAWLAAAVLVGVVIAFARGVSPQQTPDLVLPQPRERIDDGRHDAKPRLEYRSERGVLEDTPVLEPRHDRGF